MLRKQTPQQTELEMVTIASLVPSDHLLRKIDAAIDFSFIRDRVAHLYCPDNGRPALDPVVLFKMLFIGYLFGVRSERQLMREIQVNVAYRWFLGLRLTDKVADASTLSQNRRRRFADSTIYQDIFDEIVLRAIKGGLVDGTVLYNPEDRAQAAWLVNLTQPVPVPALSARQVEQAGGREAYLRRGGDEAKLNLAKDVATNILLTRREPTAHPSWYNALAAEAGLPPAPGLVSMEDMDRMRYRDRFTAAYSTRLAGLGDPVPLTREWASLLADQNSQHFRMNELLQDDLMLVSAILSTMVQPRLEQASGTMK